MNFFGNILEKAKNIGGQIISSAKQAFTPTPGTGASDIQRLTANIASAIPQPVKSAVSNVISAINPIKTAQAPSPYDPNIYRDPNAVYSPSREQIAQAYSPSTFGGGSAFGGTPAPISPRPSTVSLAPPQPSAPTSSRYPPFEAQGIPLGYGGVPVRGLTGQQGQAQPSFGSPLQGQQGAQGAGGSAFRGTLGAVSGLNLGQPGETEEERQG